MLGTPEEDNQQPNSCSDTEEGSTTSSESQVDNNSTTKAEQLKNGFDLYRESKLIDTPLLLNSRPTLGIQLPFVE